MRYNYPISNPYGPGSHSYGAPAAYNTAHNHQQHTPYGYSNQIAYPQFSHSTSYASPHGGQSYLPAAAMAPPHYAPYGQPQHYAQPQPYGQAPQYSQTQQYGQAPQYSQTQQHGQPQPYGQTQPHTPFISSAAQDAPTGKPIKSIDKFKKKTLIFEDRLWGRGRHTKYVDDTALKFLAGEKHANGSIVTKEDVKNVLDGYFYAHKISQRRYDKMAKQIKRLQAPAAATYASASQMQLSEHAINMAEGTLSAAESGVNIFSALFKVFE